MKKVLAIILCLTLVMGFVFAQGRAEKGAEKRVLLGYAALDDSQEHLIPVRENIKKVAKELDVDVIAVDNAGDGQRAINNVDNLLLQGIDCLIEFNLDSAVNPVIKEKCDAAADPIIENQIPIPI